MGTAEATQGSLLDGRLTFRQPATGYRTAIDPVLLAAAVPARAGDQIFEKGIGAGAAALCLLARVPGCTIIGEETDPVAAALASDNATANGMDGRLVVRSPAAGQDTLAADRQAFDHLMSNPPFWEAGSGNRSPHPAKAAAHHEGHIGIDRWVADLCRNGKRRASITMIYPAARAAVLITALSPLAGDLCLYPLWPKRGRPAKRLLVQARVGGKGPAHVLPGLVLHAEDGQFTEEAEAVLRGGQAIDLAG